MKFLHRPVTSLEDATANFEQLEAMLPALLLPSGLSTAGLQMGSVTMTWPGATPQAGTVAVTYTNTGRGIPRIAFGATRVSPGGGTVLPSVVQGTLTASGFTLGAYVVDGSPAAAATATVFWFAIV